MPLKNVSLVSIFVKLDFKGNPSFRNLPVFIALITPSGLLVIIVGDSCSGACDACLSVYEIYVSCDARLFVFLPA